MTTFALRSASPAKTRAEAVVVGVVPSTGKRSGKGTARLADGAGDVADAYGRKLSGLLGTLDVSGEAGTVTTLPTGGTIASPLLVLVGLGADPGPDAVRRAAGVAARAVTNAASVAVALPADSADLIQATVEGYRLGAYTFDRYRSSTSDSAPSEVVFLSPIARRQEATAALEAGQVLAGAVAATRDWVNTSGGDLTPPVFAESVVDTVKAANKAGKGRKPDMSGPAAATRLTVDVLDEEQLAELGCGGLLGVGAGSDAPPRLVEIGYHPKDAVAHLALVGKGITYDSGGLSIKPSSGMTTMKMDMAGAAAVVQATVAIARLGLPVRVTAFAAMAENMVNGSATRPGDVLRMYDGQTVEIANTDAEGRLVLADALGMAVEREPDLIIDIATLTGHMVLALGDRIAGIMGEDDSVAQVLAAAESAGEDAWPMPIYESIEERVKGSKIADLAQHDWVRWGGGLMAGAFLKAFTGGLPWVHMDIAGPAWHKGSPTGHVTFGGTGYGVATLVGVARSMSGPSDPEG